MKNLIATFDERFADLHKRSFSFIKIVPTDKLFLQLRTSANALPVYSCGEYLLRSAGAIEQTFGGLTVKLWDDPFEWTLPEMLSDNTKIFEYLNEVETTRKRGFASLESDEMLQKEIPAPTTLKTIFAIFLETIARAENFQGRAFATFKFFSDENLPRF